MGECLKTIRPIHLTNTMGGKRELLETRVPGKLTYYSCGPTVYNLIHIGNLRGGVVSDMFFRYFKRVGYDVTFVRNYTDVDDRIIERGHVEKTSSEQVAKKYIEEVEKDYAGAGMLEPDHKTCVTTHIPEIISLIEAIIQNGHAYVIEGEVLFSISAFQDYGKLSRKNLEENQAGARVEIDAKKKNPFDFSLWKPAKPGEPYWESPWGKGRPGWHIECSAMASKWLGNQIDVHHGGEDLIFPHHENEIAQSEAASGEKPFAKIWLHHAFLTLSNEKMSKSLGNVFLAHDFLARFGGEVSRYMLLSVHYRSRMDFSTALIEGTLTALERIYEAKARAQSMLDATGKKFSDLVSENVWGEFVADCEKTRREIDEAYATDFNTPEVLASLFRLIRELNRVSSQASSMKAASSALAAGEFLRVLEQDVGGILGIGLKAPTSQLEVLREIRGKELRGSENNSTPTSEEIEELIRLRKTAKENKNFIEADRIRKELLSKGITLKDSPQGTTWSYDS